MALRFSVRSSGVRNRVFARLLDGEQDSAGRPEPTVQPNFAKDRSALPKRLGSVPLSGGLHLGFQGSIVGLLIFDWWGPCQGWSEVCGCCRARSRRTPRSRSQTGSRTLRDGPVVGSTEVTNQTEYDVKTEYLNARSRSSKLSVVATSVEVY